MTSEEHARKHIDALLLAAGWHVCDVSDANIHAAKGVAIREFPLDSGFGFADYLLYIDGKACGVIEAKKAGMPLTGVEIQSGRYAKGLPASLPAWRRPLPFIYETTGIETHFTNGLDPEPRARSTFAFHQPQMFDVWLKTMQLAAKLPEGWSWSSLGQCFYVGVGATPSRKEPGYWGGEIPWVSSGEVQFGRIRQTKEQISSVGLARSSTQINPAGSVLLGMIGQGRTRGQAAILEIDAANNQNCAAIWVSKTPIPSEFVFYWLMSRYEETRRGGSENNQQALNKSLVEQIPIPVPPLTEQLRIVAEVDRRLSILRELEVEVETNLKRAEGLRQSVLSKFFAIDKFAAQ